jgi:hypothetical protein
VMLLHLMRLIFDNELYTFGNYNSALIPSFPDIFHRISKMATNFLIYAPNTS